jgi:dTDP-4-dehydrorhamnose 3,5-epimerase-like enzyme
MNLHSDGRGFGAYDVFDQAGLPGQVNISTTMPGVIRGFHWHKKQTDNIFCLEGQMHVVLVYLYIDEFFKRYNATLDTIHKNISFVENGSLYIQELTGTPAKNFPFSMKWAYGDKILAAAFEHHYIGEQNKKTLVIPPGVLHGFTPAYNKQATMCYYADQKYDPSDENRVEWDYFGEDIWRVKNE